MYQQWRTWIPFFCLFSLVVPASTGGVAQQADGLDSHLITLYVAANDKSGQSLSGLRAQDFTLLDNK